MTLSCACRQTQACWPGQPTALPASDCSRPQSCPPGPAGSVSRRAAPVHPPECACAQTAPWCQRLLPTELESQPWWRCQCTPPPPWPSSADEPAASLSRQTRGRAGGSTGSAYSWPHCGETPESLSRRWICCCRSPAAVSWSRPRSTCALSLWTGSVRDYESTGHTPARRAASGSGTSDPRRACSARRPQQSHLRARQLPLRMLVHQTLSRLGRPPWQHELHLPPQAWPLPRTAAPCAAGRPHCCRPPRSRLQSHAGSQLRARSNCA